ncbi:MAG: hypothetical protein PHV18_15805 [Lachnospiraceae bacterium]|nr:hypothetical protein [Lachnospiraceae bacterium]
MKKQNAPEDNSRVNEFENLYILTYQTLYRHVRLIFKQREKVKELLILIYMEAYQRGDQLQKEKVPVDWLMKRADFLAETRLEASKEMIEASYAEEKMQSKEAKKETWSDIDEASLLLEIEDRLDVANEQETKDTKNMTRTALQGVFSLAILIFAVAALFIGVWKVKKQLDVLHEPFERRFVEESGDDALAADPNGLRKKDTCIQIGQKAVFLSEKGKILYSLPLEESEFAGENPENPEIQTRDGWTYYLPCPERKNSQLMQVRPALYHTLYRMAGDGSEIEMIAQDVDNYTFWQDSIYISQEDRIQQIEVNQDFEKKTISLCAEVENGEIYLYDLLGRPLSTNNDGTISFEDRVFEISENRIGGVKPGVREKDHITYYQKEDDESKSIYRKVNGKEELFEEQGRVIDSFCIAGDWLYYSAYVRKGGSGANYSEIYRKSLTEDGDAALLGEEFTGRMRQMYYSEEANQIYANYIPKNWKNNHGVIAVISLSGQMSCLDDEELRKVEETTGNDMLEFVMMQNGLVYCYWEDCYWKKGEDPVVIWRKVLAIPDQNRILLD